jgi:hypothetical protein
LECIYIAKAVLILVPGQHRPALRKEVCEFHCPATSVIILKYT